MKAILILSCLALMLNSCSDDIIHREQRSVPEKGWSKSDTLQYNFEIKDTTARYDMTLEVEASSTFRYQNLYLYTKTIFPDGSRGDDIVSLELAAPSGLWNGKCSGDVCTVPIQIQENIGIKKTGNYRLYISQYSRLDTITGIKGLTLTVARTKEKKG